MGGGAAPTPYNAAPAPTPRASTAPAAPGWAPEPGAGSPAQSPRRGRMRADVVARGLVAGAAGVAAMTLAEKLEQAFTGRPNSYVPAHTLERLVGLPARPDHERLGLNWAMRWGQGIALGAVRALMAERGLRGPVGSFLLLNLRLLNDQLLENATGVGAPPWTWPVERAGGRPPAQGRLRVRHRRRRRPPRRRSPSRRTAQRRPLLPRARPSRAAPVGSGLGAASLAPARCRRGPNRLMRPAPPAGPARPPTSARCGPAPPAPRPARRGAGRWPSRGGSGPPGSSPSGRPRSSVMCGL